MIGAGMIGQIAHLANFVEIPGCEVVGVAELRDGLGSAAAKKFGVERVYASHRELIADPKVDAVVVVTRRNATGPIVLEALDAGKHVLSEKPMAHTIEQAERLVAVARERDLIYAVGFMKRFDGGVAHALKVLRSLRDSEEFGSIVFIRAYCFAGSISSRSGGFIMTGEDRPDGIELWPIAPEWLQPDLHAQYANFLNVYLHILNLVRYLVGSTPVVQSANLSNPLGQTYNLTFDDFSAVFELGDLPGGRWMEGIEIFFQRAKLTITLPQPLLRGVPAEVSLTELGPHPQTRLFTIPESWSFRNQAEAFVHNIETHTPSQSSGEDALIDIRLAEALHRCHVKLVAEDEDHVFR